MLLFAQQRVVEAGLPEHVVKMYLEQSTDRLTARMRNIIKSALRLPQPTTTQAATSSGIDETRALIASQTTYSKRMTPSERRAEAVKRKIVNEFAASSSDSADEGSARDANKKRKIDHAKEAQCSHRKMCEKAMDTMDFVKDILTKVDKCLDKANK